MENIYKKIIDRLERDIKFNDDGISDAKAWGKFWEFAKDEGEAEKCRTDYGDRLAYRASLISAVALLKQHGGQS